MRVLVYDGPHEMHIEERPRPRPGRGEVTLRIAYVGICGSDLHGYTGESGRRSPGMVMGHEASGWVEEVGDGVERLAVGDPVTFNPALPCDGRCGHEAENRCSELRVIGVTPEIQGAFADAMSIDASRVVGIGALDPKAAAMAEPFAVALQAVHRSGVAPGDDVVVLGGGMIGLSTALVARLQGAATVTVSEVMQQRRSLGTALGLDMISPDELAGHSSADVAIDAVGIPATAAASINAVRKGGTVGFVGLGLPEVAIPLYDLVVPERTIAGSFCYTDRVFAETVDKLAAGEIDPLPLLGGVEPLEAAPEAFEALASGARRDVKIIISTGASQPGGME